MRCAHESGNVQQASVIDKLGLSWPTVTDHEILPRISRRALTLTQLHTPTLGALGGVSGLHMLDGPNRASAKNVRECSGKLKQD